MIFIARLATILWPTIIEIFSSSKRSKRSNVYSHSSRERLSRGFNYKTAETSVPDRAMVY